MGNCCWKSALEKSNLHQTRNELHPDGVEAHVQKFEEFNRAILAGTELRYARLRFSEDHEETKSKNSQEVNETPCQ